MLNMLKDLTWVSDRILTARAVRCIRFTYHAFHGLIELLLELGGEAFEFDRVEI